MSDNSNSKKATAYVWSRYNNDIDENIKLHKKNIDFTRKVN